MTLGAFRAARTDSWHTGRRIRREPPLTDWTPDHIRARFATLNTWRRAGVRAPHKPLLLLFALGRVLRGEDRLVRFGAVEQQLDALIAEFGPPRKHTRGRARYPFWHLRNDGLWELPAATGLIDAGLDRSNEPYIRDLREARGGFPEALHLQLVAQPWLCIELIERMIAGHFPDSYREEIRAAIGVPTGLFQAQILAEQVARAMRYATGRPRDPAFREAVLDAWNGRCAVCGFDARLDDHPFGVEAAHVKWHSAGGPDALDNGLLLCLLHHRALDRGVLGLRADCTVKISPALTAAGVARARLVDFDGRPLADDRPAPAISAEFITWHDAQVYRCR